MIGGTYPSRSMQRDRVDFIGRWAGSGAPANGLYAPATRSDGGAICKNITLTRTGVGLYTVQITGPSNVAQTVPFILKTNGYVLSPGGTAYSVTRLTENAATGQVTLKITSGGVAADPIANETIVVDVTCSDAGQP